MQCAVFSVQRAVFGSVGRFARVIQAHKDLECGVFGRVCCGFDYGAVCLCLILIVASSVTVTTTGFSSVLRVQKPSLPLIIVSSLVLEVFPRSGDLGIWG